MNGLVDCVSPDPLFHRLSRGEPGAIDELCLRYGPRVASIARSRLGRSLRARLETADVAQEAMIDILKAAPGENFRCEAEFLRWVGVVVEHKIIQIARHWRRVRRRMSREKPITGSGSWLDPRAERPSQILERRETVERFSLALAALEPRDRAVIISRLLLELPWSRVAQALGASEEAAQMRFTRVRRRLRIALH